jgi:hypothetical protein
MTLKENTAADSLHKLSGNFVILSTNKRKLKLENLVQSFVAFITTSAALYKQSAQNITLVSFIYKVNRIQCQLQKYPHHRYTLLLNTEW